jgi:hypothetical protein
MRRLLFAIEIAGAALIVAIGYVGMARLLWAWF